MAHHSASKIVIDMSDLQQQVSPPVAPTSPSSPRIIIGMDQLQEPRRQVVPGIVLREDDFPTGALLSHLGICSAIAFTILLGVLGYVVIIKSSAHITSVTEFTQKLSMDARVDTAKKWFWEELTFGYYDGASQEMRQMQKKSEEIKVFEQSAQLCAAVLAIAALLALAGSFLATRRHNCPVEHSGLFAAAMLSVSTVCLVVGVYAPMMAAVAYKELPILGTVVFLFEAKGIVGTIGKLFTSEQIFLGFCILLFSIIIPVIKNLAMIIGLFHARFFHIGAKVLKVIGKWSMADVMIVATLLAYLALGSKEMVHAQIMVGLYFFLAYVLLSMLAYLEIQHIIKCAEKKA